MTAQQTAELTALKSQLSDGMESYRKAVGADCGYTHENVESCLHIIDSYLAAIDQTDSERLMEEVRETVERLNKLNEVCNSSLIETDQREQICEIAAKATKYAGIETDVIDITEEWRAW